MGLKRWVKRSGRRVVKTATAIDKKTQYLGRPYRSSEEKKLWEEEYSKSRLQHIKTRAQKKAKLDLSVKKGGGFGGAGIFAKGLSFAGSIGKGIREYDISPTTGIMGSMGSPPRKKRKKKK